MSKKLHDEQWITDNQIIYKYIYYISSSPCFFLNAFVYAGWFFCHFEIPPSPLYYYYNNNSCSILQFFFSFSSILKYKRSLYWQKKILNTHDEPKIIYNSSPLLFFPLSLSYLLCPKEEKKIQNNILLYTKFIFFSFQKISTTAHKYTHYTDTLVANLILSF